MLNEEVLESYCKVKEKELEILRKQVGKFRENELSLNTALIDAQNLSTDLESQLLEKDRKILTLNRKIQESQSSATHLQQ